jgi:hypothetical protein
MAVKQNKLLNEQEWEDSCLFEGELSTMFTKPGGSGGRGVTIHFSLLQQNVPSSPSSNNALHFSHVLDQLGGDHLHLFIVGANLPHHVCGMFFTVRLRTCAMHEYVNVE